MLKRLFVYSVVIACLGCIVAAGLFAWFVVFQPGDAIRQTSIKEILGVESPVYYNDGQAKIGVFFEKTHRQYVPYRQMPKRFVEAIVAAEDNKFFTHVGIDFAGVSRAMVANIRAGRVVQGGSTITQQAAKNLFKRKSRSLKAKLKELLYAFRLEYHYPKTKILEFYSNQFYVSGNGRGLGVASRYYFDKPVEELDLVECAFIAGSVKSPNSYNPFIKRDDISAARARVLAKRRTGYVLAQMYRMGKISKDQYQEAIRKEIPFRQGQMSYSLNTVMDLVKDALDTPEVQTALEEHGIDNIATSGVRIVTTVERDLQENGLRAMQQELSRLDVRMRGFDRKVVQEEYNALAAGRGAGVVAEGALLFGRVVAVDPAVSEVTVSLGGVGNESTGRIDRAGLMPLADSLARYEHQRWSEAEEKGLRFLLAQLSVGDRVFVRVREVDLLGGQSLLDLAKYPKLQGGLMIMKEGTIRAMVGGFENHFFNRAVSAKRPMGSVIKPLVYCAALQLGWNSADELDNRRDVFSFQKQAYYPRPDHESPFGEVSMSWAGVHSENLATVWLLYHLCDRLLPAQFKELAAHLGMAQDDGESYQYFRRRVRDEYGVVVDQNILRQVAFTRAIARLGPDLLFDGRTDEYEFLRKLHYGLGFVDYQAVMDEKITVSEELAELGENELAQKGMGQKEIDKKILDKKELEELGKRKKMLAKNYLRFLDLRGELLAVQQRVEGEEDWTPPPTPVAGVDLLDELGLTEEADLPEGTLFRNRAGNLYWYGAVPLDDQWQPVAEGWLRKKLARLDDARRVHFWQDVLIDGRVSVATLDQLRAVSEEEYVSLAALPPYGPEVLHQVRDFRVMVALRYMIALCRGLGIESKLDPVLSFPLGSNVLSLLEVSRVYEALASGSTFLSAKGKVGEALSIIDRVENSDGEIIFAPKRIRRHAVAPYTSVQVSDIMRNIVRFGTGKYADRNLFLRSRDPEKAVQLAELRLKWPVIGKTGTANRYTNAAFAGVVPGSEGERNTASLKGGYVVATYVGFDDNKPMTRTTTHLTGSSGALPLWTELAKSIILDRDYARNMDVVDFYFASKPKIPLRYENIGQIAVPVDAASGGVVTVGKAKSPATIVTFGKQTAEGMTPTRFFLPFWRVGESGL